MPSGATIKRGTTRRLAALLAEAGAAACVIAPLPAAAFASTPPATTLLPAPEDGTSPRTWTPSQSARARPRAPRHKIPPSAPDPRATHRTHPDFASLDVLDPIASPYRAVGLLIGKIAGYGVYTCTATIVDAASASVILTAAHCLRDPGVGGKFAEWIDFIPAYDAGAQPFGRWTASELLVAGDYASGLQGNSNYDVGAAVIAPRDGIEVGDYVKASLPIAYDPEPGQLWEAIGYPATQRFGDQSWHCLSAFRHLEQSVPQLGGSSPLGIGCDMSAGSSGGPWIGFDGIGAVTSYSLVGRSGVLYGTYLGDAARSVIDAAAS